MFFCSPCTAVHRANRVGEKVCRCNVLIFLCFQKYRVSVLHDPDGSWAVTRFTRKGSVVGMKYVDFERCKHGMYL